MLLYYWNKAVQSWVSWITLFLSHLKVTPFGSFSLSSFCEHSLPWITPRKACYPDRETSPPNLRKSRPLHSLKKHPEDQIPLLTPTDLLVKLPGVQMQWERKDLTFLYTWKKKNESVPSNILNYFKYLIYEAQLNSTCCNNLQKMMGS